MKKQMKATVLGILCLALLFSINIKTYGRTSPAVFYNKLASQFAKEYKNPGMDVQWIVLGLAQGQKEFSKEYGQTFYKNIRRHLAECNGRLSTTKYTEYSKLILAVTAVGKDARKVGDYNLLSYLEDFSQVKRQGINGVIWALIALNSNENYALPATEKKLKRNILSTQLADGGWTLMGSSGDGDVTAMAIQALAPYYGKEAGVTQAVDKALNCLSKLQNKQTGEFGMEAYQNCETTAQVIIALTTLGIPVNGDSRFIKNGHSLMDVLMGYATTDGFSHRKGEPTNGMATEQGMLALAAYLRMERGETGLYQMELDKTAGTENSQEEMDDRNQEPQTAMSRDNDTADLEGSSTGKQLDDFYAGEGDTSGQEEWENQVVASQDSEIETVESGTETVESETQTAESETEAVETVPSVFEEEAEPESIPIEPESLEMKTEMRTGEKDRYPLIGGLLLVATAGGGFGYYQRKRDRK